MENDVWTVIGANGTSVSEGEVVSLNTIIGFKHQATGYNLHSHITAHEKVTPISRQQQGILSLYSICVYHNLYFCIKSKIIKNFNI